MKPRILITEPIVEAVMDDLRDKYAVDVGERGQFNSEEALCEVIENYDALLSMVSSPVTKKVIANGKRLKVVANHAVGYNNIDLEAAQEAGIAAAHTPDVLTESTADLTMALFLSVARKIGPAQNFLRDGKFDGWDPLGFLGTELNGKTLGIVGLGRIGAATARRAKSFGLSILYHNRNRVARETEESLDASYVSSVQKLATKSDIISLHCPLTEETFHAVDEDILDRMGEEALLINTSRGPVVDEAALAEALHSGSIGGAGLDVFENEPQVHPKLLDAPNCVLTPHIGSATYHTRKAIGQLAANAIRDVLEGKPHAEISNLIIS